jgi:hypothetical protein
VRRALIALAVVVVAGAACVALISLLASVDSSQVGGAEGPGSLEPDRGSRRLGADAPPTPASAPDRPPTSGPHRDQAVLRDRAELSDDELLTVLQLGNVVIAYEDEKAPDALVALQREVSDAFDPELAAAGQAVILARRPGVGGVMALAWRRRLAASGADDPKLREFAEAWLGQGPG